MSERSPDVWRLRVFVEKNANGSPVYASKTVRGGRRKAENELRKFVGEVERSRSVSRNATLGVLLERWLDHIAPARRPTTMYGHRSKVAHAIGPALGAIPLDKLTAERLDRQYRAWIDSGLSPSTVHQYHAIIAAALHQAEKWEWIDRSPARNASAPAQGRTPARAVTLQDLHALIAEAEQRDPGLASAIFLAALTGCRRGELCALRWSDIDTAGGVLTVSRSYTLVSGNRIDGPTKTHQVRRLSLDPVALEVLRRRWAFQQWLAAETEIPLVADPYVLSRSPSGGDPHNPDWLSHNFGRLAKRLGMNWHLHELRHFAATAALADGVDVRTVSDMLGHADAHTTLRTYAHATQGAEAAAALGRALRPALREGG